MPTPQTRNIASRVRSFLAFPLPFLLVWAAISSLPKDIAAPAFSTQWPATTKFLVAFLALLSGMLIFQLALHRWSKWIDPDGMGKREHLLSNEIDNLGFLGILVAIMAYMPFAKELDLSFGITAACIAAWYVTITALAALVRRYEKLAR